MIFKQGTLRNSLQEAKAALKQLISSFIDRLGTLSESAGGYHDRLEGYAQKIRSTDDIGQLNVVLADLLADEPRRCSTGQSARRVAVENYSWTRIAERLEQVYREVAA